MIDNTENEITKIIKSQIIGEEEFSEATLNSSDGYYSIYDIKLDDIQIKEYEKKMNQRILSRTVKKSMPYMDREEIVRYERSLEVIQGTTACLKILLNRLTKKLDITVYYEQENVDFCRNRIKERALAIGLLVPELKAICNVIDKQREKTKEHLEL